MIKILDIEKAILMLILFSIAILGYEVQFMSYVLSAIDFIIDTRDEDRYRIPACWYCEGLYLFLVANVIFLIGSDSV